jgi:hypothetical protein
MHVHGHVYCSYTHTHTHTHMHTPHTPGAPHTHRHTHWMLQYLTGALKAAQTTCQSKKRPILPSYISGEHSIALGGSYLCKYGELARHQVAGEVVDVVIGPRDLHKHTGKQLLVLALHDCRVPDVMYVILHYWYQ